MCSFGLFDAVINVLWPQGLMVAEWQQRSVMFRVNFINIKTLWILQLDITSSIIFLCNTYQCSISAMNLAKLSFWYFTALLNVSVAEWHLMVAEWHLWNACIKVTEKWCILIRKNDLVTEYDFRVVILAKLKLFKSDLIAFFEKWHKCLQIIFHKGT